ncbi:unnamed protein product [Mytilus coruscus]|uniref:Uncharacterized protein n=1 Tax=Mytilus coruscus TaxID=42192 RepID=A0A6J8BGG8_MYTCO|nr:unnamed protein product [Mytilus coruscus]
MTSDIKIMAKPMLSGVFQDLESATLEDHIFILDTENLYFTSHTFYTKVINLHIMDHVPPLPFHMETLTNKHVIKLFHESKMHFRAGSQRILHRWVCSFLNQNENEIHLSSLFKRIKSVIANLRKLKTTRRYEEADAYEKHLFQIPKRFHIKPTSTNLDTQHKLISMKKKVSVLYLQLANEKKKVKRKNTKITDLKKEIDFVKVLNKRPKSTAKYVQTDAVKTLLKISMGSQCNLTRLDSMELKNEITYWQNEVIKINQMNEPDQPVPTMKEKTRGNPFSHKIRECVLACISKNVPMQNISDVIGNICKIFNIEEIDTLPSVASNEVITAIIQSIGIIYIQITAPYFSLASQYKPALEMATTYNTLVDELEKIVKNPALLLDTEYIMFPGHPPEISTFNMAVLKPLVVYSTVIECLGQMALSILSKCRKFFTNYLPGGKYHNPSLKTINESSTCPSNNISLERMMGQLDHQKTISPNISLTTINAKLMLKNNKTMEWLGDKNEEESINMAQTRKDAEILKEKYIADDIKIEQERRETIKERIEEKEAKLKKSQQHLKDVINQIDKMGGKWKNEFEMNRYIQALLYKKDKLNTLKTQILFRKDVEKQIYDKTLFRRNLDIQQLQKNLINLMEEENKITNLEDAIVPMEVDADINLSGVLSNHDNPSSPLPASSTVISNPDQLPSIPEPSTANNSQSPSSSSVPKRNQSASSSAPTQHELISKPPCWFNQKYITHTWD